MHYYPNRSGGQTPFVVAGLVLRSVDVGVVAATGEYRRIG
jgi:hypothetical protein